MVEILRQLLVIHFTRFAVLFKIRAMFSMIFKSGDCAGQESDFVSFLSLYSMIERSPSELAHCRPEV